MFFDKAKKLNMENLYIYIYTSDRGAGIKKRLHLIF